MQLSIVILNYNVRYFLEQCLLSVQEAIAAIDAEIIVVDNNSSDESVLMMKEKFPSIKLIENKDNFGYWRRCSFSVYCYQLYLLFCIPGYAGE